MNYGVYASLAVWQLCITQSPEKRRVHQRQARVKELENSVIGLRLFCKHVICTAVNFQVASVDDIAIVALKSPIPNSHAHPAGLSGEDVVQFVELCVGAAENNFEQAVNETLQSLVICTAVNFQEASIDDIAIVALNSQILNAHAYPAGLSEEDVVQFVELCVGAA